MTKYGDAITVVAIDANGDAMDGVQSFVKNFHATYSIGLEDPSTATYKALVNTFKGANPFPVDVVVGKDGTISYISREYDPDSIFEAIDAALAK